jgi:hypothetical protein
LLTKSDSKVTDNFFAMLVIRSSGWRTVAKMVLADVQPVAGGYFSKHLVQYTCFQARGMTQPVPQRMVDNCETSSAEEGGGASFSLLPGASAICAPRCDLLQRTKYGLDVVCSQTLCSPSISPRISMPLWMKKPHVHLEAECSEQFHLLLNFAPGAIYGCLRTINTENPPCLVKANICPELS